MNSPQAIENGARKRFESRWAPELRRDGLTLPELERLRIKHLSTLNWIRSMTGLRVNLRSHLVKELEMDDPRLGEEYREAFVKERVERWNRNSALRAEMKKKKSRKKKHTPNG